MEPLSLASGVITCAEACGQISKLVRKCANLKNAPEVLDQFSKEILDLHSIVDVIDDVLRGFPENFDKGSTKILNDNLDRTKGTLLELESFIVYELTTNTAYVAGTRVDKSVFFRKGSKILEFQKQIRMRKQDLVLAIGIFNLSRNQWQSSRIACLLGLIQDQSDHRLVPLSPEHGAKQLKLLIGTASENWNMRYNLNENPSVAPAERERLQLSGKFRAVSQTPNLEHSPSVLRTCSDQADDNASSVHWSEVTCDGYCRCPCHTIQVFRSPKLFENILGNLCLAYRTFPLARQGCRSFRCKARAGETTCMYTFPPWLLDWALSITCWYTLAQRPELLLRVMRKRDFQYIENLFRLPKVKIIGTIKEMLDDENLSVIDIDKDGETVLRKAIRAHSWNLARLLIFYGADINHVNFRQSRPSSPFIEAWSIRWAYNGPSLDLLAIWDTMFFKGLDSFDIFGFSTLHKAYLGLNGLVFDSVLEAVEPWYINASDLLWRTVLWWACTRGDFRAVEKLLECGADPEKQSLDGDSPLDRALQADLAVAELLLARKVDVNAADDSGATPMHSISSHTSSLIKPMMRLGASLETRDKDGSTPLLTACYGATAEVVAELLACGADINAFNFHEFNAVAEVVITNDFRILSVLLSNPNLRFEVDDYSLSKFFDDVAYWTWDIRVFDVLEEKWPIQTDFEARFDIDVTLDSARWRRDFQTEWSEEHAMPKDEDPGAWYETATSR